MVDVRTGVVKLAPVPSAVTVILSGYQLNVPEPAKALIVAVLPEQIVAGEVDVIAGTGLTVAITGVVATVPQLAVAAT